MPQDEGEYRLDTDASGDAIGAVLSQVQDGEERVVVYASRLLSHAEKNYCVTRRELLAVIYFIKHFRVYLLGRHFLLRTDHAALKWLRSMPEPVGQQARWLEQMEEYTFDIEHRPGKKHANADAMSRRPCRQCTVDQETAMGSYMCNRVTGDTLASGIDEYLEPAKLKGEYAEDPKLAIFHALFSSNEERVPWEEVVGLDKNTKHLWQQWDRMSMVDGVLYRRWVSVDGLQKRWQLVPPRSVQPKLLKLAHTGMTGGHLGIKRTRYQLQLRAYWPGWDDDTANYCKRCSECAAYHRGAPTKQGPLQIFPVGEPFERVAIDLTGPHPPSRSGHKFILTVIDLFSKWAEAIPIRNKEALTVARALMDVFVSRFGVPLQLLTDNGKEFCNSVMSELCRLLGVDKVRTTAYKASTNGAVERLHRTLNSMIGKVVAVHQRNWDELLPSIMAAYRASKHEATGYSPNFLIFGRENAAPLDVVFGLPDSEEEIPQSFDEYAEHKTRMMREAYELARDHLGNSAQRAKRYYDLRVRPNKYSVGQWVFYYYPRRYVGRSPKWQCLYTGPYLVTQVMGPVNVRIQLSRKSVPLIVHVDKLKLCLGETPPSWLGDPLVEEQPTVGFELTTGEGEREELPQVPEVDEEEEEIPVGELIGDEPDAQGDVEFEPGKVSTPGPDHSESEEVVLPQRPSREKRRPLRLADFV